MATGHRHESYQGIYRGKVVEVVDDKRGRLILEVPDVYGPGVSSPVAKACGMGGGFQDQFGACWVPPAGSAVWVMFEFGGNPQTPVWLPGWVSAAASDSDMPKFAKEEDDTGDVPDRGADIAVDAWGQEFQEPGPKKLTDYPYGRGWRSESGHLIIMDDTPGDELMQLTHKDGSQIEWGPGGSEVHRVKGSQNETFHGSVTRHFRGDVNEIYEGSKKMTIYGDYKKKVVGTFYENRVGDISNDLQGNLAQTYGATYTKTMGSESRTVQNNRKLMVLGQELKAIGKDWGLTVSDFMTLSVGNRNLSRTALAINAQQGNLEIEGTDATGLIQQGSLKIWGSIDLQDAMYIGQTHLKALVSAKVDAPKTVVGPGSAMMTAGTAVAKLGSQSTGSATLGPINLPVTVFVTGLTSSCLDVVS